MSKAGNAYRIARAEQRQDPRHHIRRFAEGEGGNRYGSGRGAILRTTLRITPVFSVVVDGNQEVPADTRTLDF